MRLPIFVLLAAVASAPAFAARPLAATSAATASAAPTFSRGAPLPKWAQTLADVPPTVRTDPVVTRLAEVQVRIGAVHSVLVNQAIQVNDPDALAEIGQYALSYFPSHQKVQLHRVAIIRANQVMDRTATVNVRLLERESGVEAGVYGGEKSVQLLLDDVRVGDTLWITYTTDGQNPVFGKRWAQDFSWDRDTPVELRRLTVLHPPQRPIYWRQLADVKAEAVAPVIDRVGEFERMRFEGRGLDAVQLEPAIPADFIPLRRLQLSEYATWREVAGWADGLFPPVAASTGLKQLAARFRAAPTRLAQASAALHWVQDEVRYFSVSIGQNSHRPQPPETVLARRFGDCKDKSYLLVSLLAELGISARPVLVNASAPKLPGKVIAAPTRFDHAIVRIELDGAFYYVDPTRTGQKGLLTRLPAVLPGAMGLLVAAGTESLVALPEDSDQAPLTESIERIAIASFDGDATLESRLVYRGLYADWARRRYPPMGEKSLRKEMLARFEKGYPGVALVRAPKLVDDADGGRFEIVSHFILPKPVTHADGRYSINYDSQVLEDTVTVPAKVVRSFPYQLPQGQFRGRYRLDIEWPAVVRATDTPIRKSIDNPFFAVSEEYTLRGNHVGYLLDYRLKSDRVPAEAMQELSVQGKRLNPFASGNWRVSEHNLALPTALGFSLRNFETMVDAQTVVEAGTRLSALKEDDVDVAELCDLTLRAVRVGMVGTAADAAPLLALPARLAGLDKKPGVRRCRAQALFAQGRFADSIPLFEAESKLRDDDALTPTLAWARFYAGDATGALADMARYRAARAKADGLTGFDIANSIALLQRLGQAVPAELFAYGSELPDGAWPRPLVAMQAGAISEADLVAAATILPQDARDLALGEAWFFIGQRRLAKGDKSGAQQAFRWSPGNGIRSSREYVLARHELAQFEPSDADYRAGVAAAKRGDQAAALALWRSSAAQGVGAAQLELAFASFQGRGVGQDYVEAMRWAKLAAGQGVGAAMNLVGSLLVNGQGVPKDAAAAFTWYQRAAEAGDSDGLRNTAGFYLLGWAPATTDPAQALAFMRQSAELGNADAQAQIARMYAFGFGPAVDYAQALFWANRASRHGSPSGHVIMAELYRTGHGVTKDLATAVKLVRAAADAGDPDGISALASLYDSGDGVAKDPRMAFTWIDKLAQKGNSYAQLALGERLRDGKGVAADPAGAIAWMEKAGAGGNAMAYNALAETFIEGNGVPKDAPRGIKYLRGCAEKGERVCQQGLAMRLHFGKGVEKDYAAAAKLYRLAAEQGMALSRNNLADLYENGFGVPQDYSRAISMYRQAANAGLPMGLISLGSLYERGKGVPANRQLAYSYFQIAITAMGGADKDPETARRQALLASQLSSAQRAEADLLAAAWKPGSAFPGDKVQ